MRITLGIDEAGRGCVIGPLVVACVAADPTDRRWFSANNVRDSKIVPPAERDRLARKIMERCWFQVKIASAPEIDAAVRDRSRTLNGLERDAMAELLREAASAFSEHETYGLVDAPSINAHGFLEQLQMASGWDDLSRLRARHEADRTDRTVAAASLIAKAERERLITALKREIGIDFGCGYSHDEHTRAHLRICARDATYVRWSWKTAETMSSPEERPYSS